jgi:hypothetical protein
VNGNGRFSLSSRLKHIDVGPLFYLLVSVCLDFLAPKLCRFFCFSLNLYYISGRRGFFFGPLTQLSARRGSHGSMRSSLRFSSSCSSLFFPPQFIPSRKEQGKLQLNRWIYRAEPKPGQTGGSWSLNVYKTIAQLVA